MTELNATPTFEQEHVSLDLEGTSLEVVELRTDEAVSQLFRIDLSCVSSDAGPSPHELLGKRAHVVLRDGAGTLRPIRGIVAEARKVVMDQGKATLELTIRPDAFRLTLGRDCRVFHDSSVVDIVKSVLARAGVEADWELMGSYHTRVYTAQYRESDWSFVSRLLEEEGIYYWFDHDERESRIVFGDRSAGAADLHGGAAVRYATETGLQTGREVIIDIGAGGRFSADRFTVGSFDHERPELTIRSSAGGGAHEMYDAPGGGPADPGVAQARAQTRLEAAQSLRTEYRGRSSSIRLVPGRLLEVTDPPVPQLGGRLFLLASKLHVRQRRWGAVESLSPPECAFRGLPKEVLFRPEALTPGARQAGLQTGVVVGAPGDEVYPDSVGRVRVQLHWDREGGRDDKAGKWMRSAQRGTADSMLLQRVGWNVMTANEEGTVDAPLVLSRFYDAEHPPPYALPDNKTRVTYKTATTPGGGSFNEIRYEDLAGSEEMFINASKDMQVLVNDRKAETVKSNAARTVVVDWLLDVGKNYSEEVQASQKVSVGASEEEGVGDARKKSVTGSESASVGAGRTFATGDSITTNVGGMRTLRVGGAQLDISLGEIKLTAPAIAVLVGGAAIKATFDKMVESVGMTVNVSTGINLAGGKVKQAAGLPGVSGLVSGLNSKFNAKVGIVVQTIGGAKFELTPKTRSIKVDGQYNETVGGMMTLKTAADIVDSSKSSSTLTVAGPLSAKAREIVVEATDELVVECGSTKLTINKSEVKLESPSVDLSQASLMTAKGSSQVKIN